MTIGMLDPSNSTVLTRIGDLLERPLHAVRLNRYEVESALGTGFGTGSRTTADLVIRPRPPSRGQPTAVEIVDSLLLR